MGNSLPFAGCLERIGTSYIPDKKEGLLSLRLHRPYHLIAFALANQLDGIALN